MKRYFFFVFAPLVFLMSGCATIRDDSGYRVYVRVASDPPGAPIVVRGRTVGRTPALVEVPRARTNVVSLLTADGPKQVLIDSDYRWSSSFFGNFVLLPYAPIGWAIDLLSGAAWEPLDPPVVPVKLKSAEIKAAREERRPEVIAIPPPIASTISISDAGGEALEDHLKKRGAQVLPYRSTLKTFIQNDYDFDERPHHEKARRVYRLLGATKIYESTIESDDDKWLLRATPIDVESGESGQPVDISLKTESTYYGTLASLGWFSRIFPNAIGFDIVNDAVTLSERDPTGKVSTYVFQPVSGGSFWEQSVQVVSSISISNVPPRRYGRSSRWLFQLVPSFTFSRKRLKLTGLEDGSENENMIYRRWLIAGGYGPEIGWQKSQHYIYLNLIPMFTWAEVSWPGPQGERSETATDVTVRAEIGYSFFITNEWSITLFTSSIDENTNLWRKVLADRIPDREVSSRYVTFSQYGISIAYRFEPPFAIRR